MITPEECYHQRAVEVITAHRALVKDWMIEEVRSLLCRADQHDLSKFSPQEIGPLADMQRLIDTEGQAPYGSAEYKRRTDLLGPMTAHHYAHNSHHPEHFADGVAGMDILDIVEMLCDWKAASTRGGENAIGLTHSLERFGITGQMASVIRNTLQNRGWAFK